MFFRGDGTTEYALQWIASAANNSSRAEIVVPVEAATRLPMIYITDLIEGMIKLTTAPRPRLKETNGGYALAGFSFSASELQGELEKLSVSASGFTTPPIFFCLRFDLTSHRFASHSIAPCLIAFRRTVSFVRHSLVARSVFSLLEWLPVLRMRGLIASADGKLREI